MSKKSIARMRALVEEMERSGQYHEPGAMYVVDLEGLEPPYQRFWWWCWMVVLVLSGFTAGFAAVWMGL